MWATAVPGPVLSGPTVDGAGLIAVATYKPTKGATTTSTS